MCVEPLLNSNWSDLFIRMREVPNLSKAGIDIWNSFIFF